LIEIVGTGRLPSIEITSPSAARRAWTSFEGGAEARELHVLERRVVAIDHVGAAERLGRHRHV
jgi:hypothetical protein